MIVANKKTKIGPQQHGRKMSLRAFEFAAVEEGCLCELARGYIVVSNVPNYAHARRSSLIRRKLDVYYEANPGTIHEILTSMECKLFISAWESERHPDIAVYLSPPRHRKDRTMWRTWFPDLAVEVVSEGSRDRDYTEKRDEYWTLGVKEYWIVDAMLEQVLVLRRGKSQWIEKTLHRGDVCETKLLPGFKLSCDEVFDAAAEEEAGD